ncbi:MAG TPA: serine/threonine-protein kinase [Polyangiaceae bacterium]|nr:serine/threonine-protein kinase [Polyangiaceae bacterium]
MASGGMATVFLGALEGAHGFRQIVAIKRPHPHLLDDRGFRDAWLREARLASGIHHANVVDVRDVEDVGDAIQLVMDYIEGASLGELVATRASAGGRLPPRVAVRIVLDACAGLHAAHEARDDAGKPLGLVHRDVSPQNILVGVDGVARVTDFGIAKCVETSDGTSRNALKGKAGYMAPEYVRGEDIDRRADVFALGVVLWEALCGRRLFRGQTDAETLERVLSAPVPPVSATVPTLAALDPIVARAVERVREARFPTVESLARALEQAAESIDGIAKHADVARFVQETVGDKLEERRRALRDAPRDVGAPAEPTEAPTVQAVPRRKASRVGLALVVGGVLMIAGATVLLLARRSTPPAGALSAPPPTPAETLTASVSAAATATATPTPTPTATATATPTPTPTPTHPPKPAHAPPPNPYPAGR